MSDKEWEELFRSRLYHYPVEPDPMAFEAIMLKANTLRKRTRLLPLIIGLLFGVVQSPHGKEGLTKTDTNTHSSSQVVWLKKQQHLTSLGDCVQIQTRMDREILQPKTVSKQESQKPSSALLNHRQKTRQLARPNKSPYHTQSMPIASSTTKQSVLPFSSDSTETVFKSRQTKPAEAFLASSVPNMVWAQLQPFEIQTVTSVKKRKILHRYYYDELRLEASFSQGLAYGHFAGQNSEVYRYRETYQFCHYQGFGLKLVQQLSRRLNVFWGMSYWRWEQMAHYYGTTRHPIAQSVEQTADGYLITPVFGQHILSLSQTHRFWGWEAGASYLVKNKRYGQLARLGANRWYSVSESNEVPLQKQGWAVDLGYDIAFRLTHRLNAKTGLSFRYHLGQTLDGLLDIRPVFIGWQMSMGWKIK